MIILTDAKTEHELTDTWIQLIQLQTGLWTQAAGAFLAALGAVAATVLISR
jgi:hypothetical protein